jgi:MFS family permease
MHAPTPALGLRENIAQLSLLILINAFVGAMVGMERSILPALAEQEFSLVARAAILSFIVVFGVSKALTNYFTGRAADRWGRRPLLLAGWLIAAPVPFLLMWAPTWSWILAANVLLGVSQGLTWSTTVIMKIDLVGPKQRGLAMGLNEFAGYLAVALSALATGYLAARYTLRPAPFWLGVGYVAAGLSLSALFARETLGHVAAERSAAPQDTRAPSQRELFWRTTLKDRTLSAVTQAGFVNNLNDGMAWGLFPFIYAAAGLTIERIGALAAIYPAVWGIGQIFTGALSDRLGRRPLIVAGMWLQAAGIVAVALGGQERWFIAGSVSLGLGTAMVYPTLLAAIGDVAHPTWRASAVGIYRLWRDLGYAAGALLAGLVADQLGITAATLLIAAITALSGLIALLRMPPRPPALTATSTPCAPLDRLHTSPPPLLIDVRPAADFERAHVADALNIPLAELGASLSSIDLSRPIITICGKGGGRSLDAALMLQQAGAGEVAWLCGGTDAWLIQQKNRHHNA